MLIQVDEFLRTCRLHHRTLVVVSVTALLFGFAPSDRTKLNQAIKEAELLSEVDFTDLLSEALREKDETKFYIDKITATLYSLDISYKRSAYQALFGNIYSLPQDNWTIAKLQKYILEKQYTRLNIPQVDDQWFDRIKQFLTANKLQNKQLNSLQCSGSSVQLYFNGGTQNKFEIESSKTKGIEVQADLVKVIQRDPKYRQLIQDRKGDKAVVFPYLHGFWQEVRDVKPRQAVAYLAYRKVNTIENITFLGLSIPAYLASFAVPLATFLLTLHLYLYTMKLVELVKPTEKVMTEDQIFPWLAIFKDRISQTLSFVSNPTLPFFANVIIIYRSWNNSSWFASLIAIFFTLVTVFLGFRSYSELAGNLCLLFHSLEAKR